MQETFNIIVTIVFFILGLAWKKSDPINFLVKISLILFGICGLILVLHDFGHIVKL
jgi:hypothetical protein